MKSLKKTKTVQEKQEIIIFAIEKLSNLAISKTKKGEEQSVLIILGKLEEMFKKMWGLKNKNPEKFDTLIWKNTFYNRYVKPISESSPQANIKKIKKEASMRLFFAPEEQMTILPVFLEQLVRIWQTAFYYEHDDVISRNSVYRISWLLADVVQESGNSIYIKGFLDRLNTITWRALNELEKYKLDRSVYSAAINWYPYIVFSHTVQTNLHITEYLDILNEYFFKNITLIISKDKKELFESLVSTFVDGIHVPGYDSHKLFDITRIAGISYTEESLAFIRKLHKRQDKIVSDEGVKSWIDELNEFVDHLSTNNKKEIEELKNKVIGYVLSKYKFNNLMQLIYSVGGYCLFKEKFEYIKKIWNYRQPKDAGASWGGNDIIPNNINQAMNYYFMRRYGARNFDFREGHHGSESYYKMYFLLIIAKNLVKVKENDIENKYAPQTNDVQKLNNIKFSMRSLSGIAKSDKFKEYVGILLNKEKADDIINSKLIPFLNAVKEKANAKIDNIGREGEINKEKEKKFKKQVVGSFYSAAKFRKIFQRKKLLNEDLEKVIDSVEKVNIELVAEKAIFLENWYVDYSEEGKRYGEGIANHEDTKIYNKLSNNCKEIDGDEFETRIKGMSGDVIILGFGYSISAFLENKENYKPKWQLKNRERLEDNVLGIYKMSVQKETPVYSVYHNEINNQILMIDMKGVKNLAQYNPVGKNESNGLLKDIFYINIIDLNENVDKRKSIVDESSEWLTKIGNEEEQHDYLRSHVIINIREKFDLLLNENFEGYKINLEQEF